MSRNKTLFALSTAALTSGLIAASTLSARADDDSATAAAKFRCEKLSGMTLKDLKAKLVENCNLNKPFSIAGTDSALNNSFTYCCNSK